jgi:hypothetical protein
MKDKPLLGITAVVAAVSVVVACGGTGKHDAPSPAAATTAPAAQVAATGTTVSSTTKAARAYRAQVVKAADAWLASLTAAQRKTATYDFGNTTAKEQWSNFPAFFKPRTGVAYTDMSAAASKAGRTLARAVLSKQGYKQYSDTRQADNYLGVTDSGAGPGGNGGGPPNGGTGGPPNGGTGTAPSATPTASAVATPTPTAVTTTSPAATVPAGGATGNFGQGNFYISVFGSPSNKQAFMVSFNGHHMSFNITFQAKQLANTPEFSGVEPSDFTLNNEHYQPMKLEADAAFALLPKLPSQAKLSQSFDDVLVGPQKDGQFPTTHSGVKVTALSAAARKQVTALIRAYVGDVPDAIAKPLMARYEKQYAKTYVAYAGSTVDAPGTYIRIDGPQAWIELAVQSTDKGSSHYHSVYRDKLHDYGA